MRNKTIFSRRGGKSVPTGASFALLRSVLPEKSEKNKYTSEAVCTKKALFLMAQGVGVYHVSCVPCGSSHILSHH